MMLFKRLKCIFRELFTSGLYYAAFLMPRSRNKCVFSYGANAKYLFWSWQTKASSLHCYLIVHDINIATHLHKTFPNVLYAGSIKAKWHMFTSKYFFCTVDTRELSFIASGGATVINLWHGVGIKKMGAINKFANEDIAYKIGRIKRRFNTGYLSIHPSYLLSTSPLMNRHFADCFELKDEQIIEGFYPRCQFMVQPQGTIRDYLRHIDDQKSLDLIGEFSRYRKVFLYMPTWRDSGSNILTEAGFDFSELDQLLGEKNYLFVLKLHPNTRVDTAMVAQCHHIMLLDNQLDLYPILPFTSMLITDYSSIYYDYLLLDGKEILLFPYDETEYLQQCRDFAFDYKECTPGDRVYTFHELLQCIAHDTPCVVDEREHILKLFWGTKPDLSASLFNLLRI